MDNYFTPKNAGFFCENCNFKCSKGSDWKRHILTIKHSSGNKWITKDNAASPIHTSPKLYTCLNCSRVYRYASGLSKHKKTCIKKQIPNNNDIDNCNTIGLSITENDVDNSSQITPDLVMEVLKQNKDLHNLLIEQNKAIVELTKNVSQNNINTNNYLLTNNNSHNKTFNLNLFLNEKCKDAMNISDFVSSIKMNLSDLEKTGRVGYAEGISSIINNNLKDIDIHMRPIHCTDFRREVIYIKDNGVWEREQDNKVILTRFIKEVAFKNIKQIIEWKKEYPDCTDADSRKNDLYLKITSNAMSGIDKEETEKNINKIINNIAKNVLVDKNIY